MANLVAAVRKIKPQRDFFDHFYISFKHRYAFHTVGKAANSTVKNLLYELELEGTHFKIPSVHDRASAPLLSPYQLSDRDLETVFRSDEFLRFTFVRNPFSRLLSCYLDRIQKQNSRPYRELIKAMGKKVGHEPTFRDFITTICAQTDYEQNNHWRVQYSDALCAEIDYDFVGKQENFAKDFSHVYYRISGQFPELDSLNVNASPQKTDARSRLNEYWDLDLVECVQEKYASDFSRFRYSLQPE